MKTRVQYICVIVLAVVIVFMAACTSDSITSEQPIPTDDADLLQLRIATNAPTRARTTNWVDENAQDEEMMNLWVVIVTKTSDGSVVKCFACRPSAGAEREIDEVGRIARGAYTVYSFANISVANLCNLLGLTAPSTIPTIGITPTEIAVTGTVNHTNALAATATINGNNFNSSAADNGYGEMGIPMSNMQTTADTDLQKDLIVVRMLAKMQINIKNETGAETTVQSLTISDITSNATNNLKLLPSLSYPNDMDAHHQDIRPNLSSSATTADLTVSVNKSIANDATETLTFYINESATPTNAEGLFYLTLKMSDTEYRYALISNNAANEWNYIARNDYRIIPIVLDDYKLELIPYDFPPIGVYPASVREIDNELYEMTFHDYGHFHLVPKVTKMSNNSTVAYSSDAMPSGTVWTLNTDFAGSWKTAATKGGAWLTAEQITTNGFYRNQTATTDGDDAGGVPVWYANTSSPQWDPAGGSNYNPFIFGYIADPGADPGDTWWSTTPSSRTDKQIFHEFRVKLYVGGTYRRDLLYRFYMTLSKDQMLGTRGQASRHYHGR